MFLLKNWIMRDRSRVIPKGDPLQTGYGNQLEEVIGDSRPDLVYIFYMLVKPAAIAAETEKQHYEDARVNRIAVRQEMGELLGQIADWDEQTALLLAGPLMWIKIIVLSVLASLGGLRLTFRRETPKQFRDSADYSTWMVLFTAIPLGLSTCRLVGIRINHGITVENLVPILLILGFSLAVNLSLKEGVALWVRVTRHGTVQADGSIHIEVVHGFKDPVLLFSILAVLLEMLVGAPGIIGALPITIAKQPLWQFAALLLGSMGALANQVLAWSAGIKAKRRELRWLHFRAQQDALWEERREKVSRAFELQKLMPEIRREERWYKRRSQAAHRQALQVYRYWWQNVTSHLEDMRDRSGSSADVVNGHRQAEHDREPFR